VEGVTSATGCAAALIAVTAAAASPPAPCIPRVPSLSHRDVWGMANFLWLICRYLSQDDNDQLRVVLRINMTAAAVGLVWAA
jgi:hypothetical protein